VTATADGGLIAKAEHPVTVQMARLAITKTGPAARYVNRPATWDIRVSNPGEVAVTNVVVRDQLPADLGFVSATEGGQFNQNQVIWNIGTLQPQEQKLVQVTTNCLRITEKAINVAIATADPGLQVQAESGVEIRGLPAFMLEVLDNPDPVEVGGRTTYTINVTNQGSLPGNQVQISAFVPKEMRVINARGPSTPRVDGNTITFPGVDSVQPKQKLEYFVDVQAIQAGDVRFRVELRSQTLGNVPVVEEESTNIYDAGTGTRPAPSPAGTPPPPAPMPPGLPPAPSPTGMRLTPSPAPGGNPSPPVIATTGMRTLAPSPTAPQPGTIPVTSGFVIPPQAPSSPTSGLTGSTGPSIPPP
jgi:uncharacterized repeat protein (TIGR01451 family)